jgi:adenylate cyclase
MTSTAARDSVEGAEAAWRQAGLLDVEAGRVSERLELLAYLHDRGATTEEMVDAQHQGLLLELGSLLHRQGERVSPRQAAQLAGLTLDDLVRVGRASGLPMEDVDAPTLRAEDVDTFRVFSAGATMFGQATALQFTRVAGAAMATIADAAMSTFGLGVMPRLDEAQATELERAKAVEDACELLLSQVPSSLSTLFFYQVEAAARRWAASGMSEPGCRFARMAVGFLDLVGSTSMAQRLEPGELGDVVARFEQEAVEKVSARGGRVVKTIGDEVMFVMPAPEAACEVAILLCEYADGDSVLPPLRGAVAYGDLIPAYGDFYGPTVNVAARAIKLAAPGTLLVTGDVVDGFPEADPCYEARSVGLRHLRGFDSAIELFTLARLDSPVAA